MHTLLKDVIDLEDISSDIDDFTAVDLLDLMSADALALLTEAESEDSDQVLNLLDYLMMVRDEYLGEGNPDFGSEYCTESGIRGLLDNPPN